VFVPKPINARLVHVIVIKQFNYIPCKPIEYYVSQPNEHKKSCFLTAKLNDLERLNKGKLT
jgi:hypothetical protein